ncbi:hypothetical protein NIES2134_112370 [Thermostichus vulcanus NIES-2134]|nr:hypothetical protein NIES2134_112370 [Thermostichus vulcanus NIES-2134]
MLQALNSGGQGPLTFARMLTVPLLESEAGFEATTVHIGSKYS